MKKKTVLWTVVALATIGGGYAWHSKSGPEDKRVRYVTARAERGTVVASVNASGNVVVDQVANIDPTISGTVAGLAVRVGDRVEKGQLLFTIVNDQLDVSVGKAEASLHQALNAVDSAKVDVRQAKADYDAAKDNNSYTGKQRAVLKDKIKVAEAKVVAARKNYDATLADYRSQAGDAAKRRVTAPISGTVNAVNVKNGDDLGKASSNNARETPVIIGDLGTMKAEVRVNEVDIPKVGVGQAATLTFDAVEGLAATGRVEKMDALGTLSSGVVTYGVTVAFGALDPRIRPGMSVSAAIVMDTKEAVVSVPNSAVRSRDGKPYVQVLANGAPENRDVKTGIANGTHTEVISGLSVGEEVVTQTIDPSAPSAGSPTRNGTAGGARSFGGPGRIPGL
jgi:RND family efflux transporter MFP subunit